MRFYGFVLGCLMVIGAVWVTFDAGGPGRIWLAETSDALKTSLTPQFDPLGDPVFIDAVVSDNRPREAGDRPTRIAGYRPIRTCDPAITFPARTDPFDASDPDNTQMAELLGDDFFH